MHRVLFCFFALALVLSMVVTGCKEDLSSEKDITDFAIAGVDVTITGNEIWLIAPVRTDLAKAKPVITITGKSISPASEEEVDLTFGADYTVKAEDDSTKTYQVYTLVVEGGEVQIGLVPDGNNNINVYGLQEKKETLADKDIPEDCDIVLSTQLKDAADERYNPNLPKTLLISIGAPPDDLGHIYDSIRWDIDGVKYDNAFLLKSLNQTNWEDKNIVLLYAEDYSYMIKHYITIIVKKDGIEHSQQLTFVVVR